MNETHIIFESEDKNLIFDLYTLKTQTESLKLSVERPTKILGFGESLYELAATLGIISLPIGIIGNIIASWIWDAFRKNGISENKSILRVSIRSRNREVHIEIIDVDKTTTEKIFIEALKRLDTKK